MSQWFKSYLPRKLYGRALLILIVPVVLSQLLVSVVFVQRHFDGVTRQLTGALALDLALLIAEGRSASDAGGDALAAMREPARLLQLDLEAAPTVPGADRIGLVDLSGRSMRAALQAELPEFRSVDLMQAPDGAVIWVEIAGDAYRIGFARTRISAANPHQLFVIMVLGGVIFTLIAYLFLRNQLRPITRLAEAAEAFGRGESVLYHPAGATEVRAAGAAFLEMRSRIERQIEQRTLMLSGVSHDLRTPLTRMKLSLEMLEQTDDIRAMHDDIAGMERMLKGFLDFLRAGSSEPHVPADPVALVRTVVEQANRAGQQVTWLQGDSPGLVSMQVDAVRRALDNLIGNAVRYGTRVVVSVRGSPAGVAFVIDDDGPGIPEELRAEALRPFTRLGSERDPNHGGGVGLGLAIAADVARSHGGQVELGTSDDLGGLRAVLLLPR